MAYKVFSNCVENGKVVQKAPSSTLAAVGVAVRTQVRHPSGSQQS